MSDKDADRTPQPAAAQGEERADGAVTVVRLIAGHGVGASRRRRCEAIPEARRWRGGSTPPARRRRDDEKTRRTASPAAAETSRRGTRPRPAIPKRRRRPCCTSDLSKEGRRAWRGAPPPSFVDGSAPRRSLDHRGRGLYYEPRRARAATSGGSRRLLTRTSRRLPHLTREARMSGGHGRGLVGARRDGCVFPLICATTTRPGRLLA